MIGAARLRSDFESPRPSQPEILLEIQRLSDSLGQASESNSRVCWSGCDTPSGAGSLLPRLGGISPGAQGPAPRACGAVSTAPGTGLRTLPTERLCFARKALLGRLAGRSHKLGRAGFSSKSTASSEHTVDGRDGRVGQTGEIARHVPHIHRAAVFALGKITHTVQAVLDRPRPATLRWPQRPDSPQSGAAFSA